MTVNGSDHSEKTTTKITRRTERQLVGMRDIKTTRCSGKVGRRKQGEDLRETEAIWRTTLGLTDRSERKRKEKRPR